MTSYGQVQKLDLVDTRTKVKPEESKEEARCKYCKRKGHGATPGLTVIRGGLGHFAGTKACRGKPGPQGW